MLKENHVKAVFCLWGDFIEQNPDLVCNIVAGGHTLCNHTMHHDNISSRSAQAIRADLGATSAVIHEVAPDAPIPYFRAPYGA